MTSTMLHKKQFKKEYISSSAYINACNVPQWHNFTQANW